ncbi:MAG: hypothetical protein U5K75_10975 [Ahrensia sp.]|nr:hypothetical protein [Ahrensia sp.]
MIFSPKIFAFGFALAPVIVALGIKDDPLVIAVGLALVAPCYIIGLANLERKIRARVLDGLCIRIYVRAFHSNKPSLDPFRNTDCDKNGGSGIFDTVHYFHDQKKRKIEY